MRVDVSFACRDATQNEWLSARARVSLAPLFIHDCAVSSCASAPDGIGVSPLRPVSYTHLTLPTICSV